MFSKKSISILFGILVIPVLFNNCSAGKTFFGSTEKESEGEINIVQQNTGDDEDNGNPIDESFPESVGKIVHRPRCLPSAVQDYNSYCNVSSQNFAAVEIANVSYFGSSVPSCEIVVNGKSSIFHLNGPLYIGQEVNNRAVKVYYANYMTLEEFNAASEPCNLAIDRASAAQNQDERITEENEWGTTLAKQLSDAAKSNDRAIQQKVLGLFVFNHYTLFLSYAVQHCINDNNQTSTVCGTSHFPRWKNPPAFIRDISIDTDYSNGNGLGITLDQDLFFADYLRAAGR